MVGGRRRNRGSTPPTERLRSVIDAGGRSAAQRLLERGLAVRPLVPVLGDDQDVLREMPVVDGVPTAHRPADDDGVLGNAAARQLAEDLLTRLGGITLVDVDRTRDRQAGREHRTAPHDHALGDLGVGTDEDPVAHDGRAGVGGFEYTADPRATREVAVLADLRARADARAPVDHRAISDVGADVDEPAGHDDDLATEERGLANHRTRYDADLGVLEVRRPPRLVTQRNLVEDAGARTEEHRIVHAEAKNDALLDPFVIRRHLRTVRENLELRCAEDAVFESHAQAPVLLLREIALDGGELTPLFEEIGQAGRERARLVLQLDLDVDHHVRRAAPQPVDGEMLPLRGVPDLGVERLQVLALDGEVETSQVLVRPLVRVLHHEARQQVVQRRGRIRQPTNVVRAGQLGRQHHALGASLREKRLHLCDVLFERASAERGLGFRERHGIAFRDSASALVVTR